MTRLLVVSVIGAGVALSAPAGAQLCNGSASFGRSPVQLSAQIGHDTDADFFGGGVAVGGGGPFLELAGVKTNWTLGGSSSTLGAGVGYQVALDPKIHTHLCPLASVQYLNGPKDFDLFNNGVLWDVSRTTYTLGVAIGAAATLSRHAKFLPFASLHMVSSKLKTFNHSLGTTRNTTETGSHIEFGFGLLFNDAFSFRPSLGFTTGVDRTVTTFALGMTVNLWRRGSD